MLLALLQTALALEPGDPDIEVLAWDAVELAAEAPGLCLIEAQVSMAGTRSSPLHCSAERWSSAKVVLADSRLSLPLGTHVLEYGAWGDPAHPLRLRPDLRDLDFEDELLRVTYDPEGVVIELRPRMRDPNLPRWAPELPGAAWIEHWAPPTLTRREPSPPDACRSRVAIDDKGAVSVVYFEGTQCSTATTRQALERMSFSPLIVEGRSMATQADLVPDRHGWSLQPPPDPADQDQTEDLGPRTRPRKLVSPRMPQKAKELGIEADCKVRVHLDERGQAEAMVFEACPVLFHGTVVTALTASRFEPPHPDEDESAEFVLLFKFRLMP